MNENKKVSVWDEHRMVFDKFSNSLKSFYDVKRSDTQALNLNRTTLSRLPDILWFSNRVCCLEKL